jgi:3-hydroxyisobutyrate dehydrogenase
VAFVDAPVSGSSQPAADGQLLILAAGAPSTRPRLEPIFEPLARQILWLDRVGDGSRLKLALNNWLAVQVEGMAQTLTLCRALGIDPHLFVTTIAGGPLASP